jgi:cell division protein FtsL
MFRRDDQAAPVRSFVIALVVIACLLVAFGVARRHEVLQIGYQLSHEVEHVRELREAHRRLELELATLSAPDRIRRLASELGMAPVAADRIRVVTSPQRPKVAAAP